MATGEDSISLPRFDPSCMTVDSFIIECEDYFAIKNVSAGCWHILAGCMFEPNSDLLYWYRTKRSSFTKWSDFVSALKSYEGSDVNKDELMQRLFSKRQMLSEPFESFAWDIHHSFRKVDATVSESSIVDRILHSSLPEMSQALLPHKCTSVEDLIKTAKIVIGNMNKIRKMENKPLLRVRRSDPISTFATTHANEWKKPTKGDEQNADKSASSSENENSQCTSSLCVKLDHSDDQSRVDSVNQPQHASVGNSCNTEPDQSLNAKTTIDPSGNVERQ